jgi:hypothetical protein
LWKRQQRSRQNEENEKRDEIRKQNKIRTKTFRERQKKVELELNAHLTNSFSNEILRFSMSSGDGDFFSLTRVLTVGEFLGKYADTTSVLLCGDFGKLLINLETTLCFIVLFEKLFVYG